MKSKIAVSEISLACFVPGNSGSPVHRNRKYHGLAFSFEHTIEYEFLSGEKLRCASGECAYLPKGSDYNVNKISGGFENSGTYAINFLFDDRNETYKPFKIKFKNPEAVLSAFERARRAWKNKGVGFEEECFSELYTVIKLLKAEAFLPSNPKNLSVIMPAVSYIKEHYTEEAIKIPVLAELCSVSEQYLRRMFASSLGVSPAVYIRNMRIKYAKELIISGEHSVSEVATLSGFEDVSYFSREFKKAVGVSPSEFANSENVLSDA